MNQPTKQQIKEVAERMAVNLGGGVHVKGSDVAFAVDANFPGMTDKQFDTIRPVCYAAADTVRSHAMTKLWGEA